MPYSQKQANKGKPLEDLIIHATEQYKAKGLCNIQKIHTPTKVVRKGKDIVGAFYSEKSTVDFRGTVKGGYPVSFDCKETECEKGLPLSEFRPHQIDFMELAMSLGETCFAICEIKPLNKIFIVSGMVCVNAYHEWQQNKGKRGYNIIETTHMYEIKNSKMGIVCGYLESIGLIT